MSTLYRVACGRHDKNRLDRLDRLVRFRHGGVPERPNGTDSKSADVLPRRPWVQIPPPPPQTRWGSPPLRGSPISRQAVRLTPFHGGPILAGLFVQVTDILCSPRFLCKAVQNPHWLPPEATSASTRGPATAGSSPSAVVTERPATRRTGVTQDTRGARPPGRCSSRTGPGDCTRPWGCAAPTRLGARTGAKHRRGEPSKCRHRLAADGGGLS